MLSRSGLTTWFKGIACGLALGLAAAPVSAQDTKPGATDLSGEKLSGGELPGTQFQFEGLPYIPEADKGEKTMHPYLFADLLLLKARRQSYDYAITSLTPIGNGVVGDMQNLDYSFRAGFRAGAGIQLPDQWQVEASFFNYHSTNDRYAAAPNGGTLYATTTNLSYDEIGTAQANGSVNFSVLDIDFGRWVELDPSFSFRFTGGTRLAWIDQNFSALYNGGPQKANNSMVNMPIYFSGGGITAGAEGVWNFLGKIGLYGRGKGGLIAGRFSSRLNETADNGSVTNVNIHDKYEGVVPTLDLGLGLCYRGEIATVRIGYDLFNYFDMVDSLQFPGPQLGNPVRRTSNISLEGVTMEIGFKF